MAHPFGICLDAVQPVAELGAHQSYARPDWLLLYQLLYGMWFCMLIGWMNYGTSAEPLIFSSAALYSSESATYLDLSIFFLYLCTAAVKGIELNPNFA